MKKHPYIATLLAIILFGAAGIFAQTGDRKPDENLSQDFGRGMGGDAAILEAAIQRAEKILAANPKHSLALVWLGSATLRQSGGEFMKGNFAEGGKMWAEGRRKMDEAVSLDGENLEVLIVRGSTYLNASTKYPIKEEAEQLRTLGTADLEKIIKLSEGKTDGKTDGKSVGIRRQTVKQFVDYYTQTGNLEKAASYKKMLPAQ